MVSTLTQILDTVDYLGLSHGDLLAMYHGRRTHREMMYKHAYQVKSIPMDKRESIGKMVYQDILDHYARIILAEYLTTREDRL